MAKNLHGASLIWLKRSPFREPPVDLPLYLHHKSLYDATIWFVARDILHNIKPDYSFVIKIAGFLKSPLHFYRVILSIDNLEICFILENFLRNCAANFGASVLMSNSGLFRYCVKPVKLST